MKANGPVKSNKKARKLEKKVGYARQRAVEEELERQEVEMKDVRVRNAGKANGGKGEEMEVD